MAYTTINKSTDHFNTKLYTGNGGTQSITGVGFQPDWTILKGRNGTNSHNVYDAVRGAGKTITTDANYAESTDTARLTSFDSDGFSLGSNNNVNQNSINFVSWNWKANGQGSSNTDGSINTTYTSVNTTAGFSISKYNGTGSGATVGHGLNATPKIILWKRLDSNDGDVNWIVQSPLLDNRNKLVLNTTEAKSYNSSFANVDNWSNSVFTLGTYEGQNDSNGTYVAYAFAEKPGYSKFGTYTGNGNADGTFVYTGMKVSWVMIKNTEGTDNWNIYDNKRLGYNTNYSFLIANESNTENTTTSTANLDILSNGFKVRASTGHLNTSGNKYIYMAFGQSLVGSNNVPCTAR
jgi:hypothetical protein